MKAVAVFPKKPGSVHLAELEKPSVNEVRGGRGVLVKVLRVGVDGTDKEINAGEYGAPPEGDNFLVLGHENFGRVEAVGANVAEPKPGDYVVATVRRPGTSLYDVIGTNDMTTDDTYFERGINLRHGFLTEYYVDDAEFIVKLPERLKHVGVLLEPATVVEKGVHQAYEIQRRLRVWRPRRAAVMGAGTIGLFATLVLRLRGRRTAIPIDDAPLSVDDNGGAQRSDLQGGKRTPVSVFREHHVFAAAYVFPECLPLLEPVRRKEIARDDFDALIPTLRPNSCQCWSLQPAGRSPRKRKVEHDDLALLLREAKLAVFRD